MFLAYVSPLGRVLVDKRLYLPESWTSDKDRCVATGVPEERQSYRSKTELALDMLQGALEPGHLSAGWVAADDAFGMSPSFREGLAALGMCYVLYVPAGFTVWPPEPERTSPPYQGRGAPRKPRLVSGQRRTMQERAGAIPEEAWREITVAEGSQGPATTGSVRNGCGRPEGGSPAKSSGRFTGGTWTTVSPDTICPTLLKTLPWRPWSGWAVPDGALRPNSRLKRATWGWTSTRRAPGPAGIIPLPCACWLGHSC